MPSCDPREASVAVELLAMIMIQRRSRPDGDAPVRFLPGMLVRHRRYGYRGVVVDFDPYCTAPDEWYLSNQTRPDKDQPWYHVLVDGAAHTTYAAEQSLEPDEAGTEIVHPLVELFFSGFRSGRYVRNDRPWGAPS